MPTMVWAHFAWRDRAIDACDEQLAVLLEPQWGTYSLDVIRGRPRLSAGG